MQITYRDLPPSPSLEAIIKLRAEKLLRFGRVTNCRVVVEARPRRQFHIQLELTVPGGNVVVSHEPDGANAYVAVREAFESARRRLDENAQRL
jgi:ribosome-associated translation inhibitor RaiA